MYEELLRTYDMANKLSAHCSARGCFEQVGADEDGNWHKFCCEGHDNDPAVWGANIIEAKQAAATRAKKDNPNIDGSTDGGTGDELYPDTESDGEGEHTAPGPRQQVGERRPAQSDVSVSSSEEEEDDQTRQIVLKLTRILQ